VQFHVKTPLLEDRRASDRIGRRVFLKLECLQPTGSFKIRGIGHLCLSAATQNPACFISASAGNAGVAVAYAGQKLKLPVKVVIPKSAGDKIRNILASYGAQIIESSGDWLTAHTYALEMQAQGAGYYIHPFEHPLIWQGHSTIVDEMLAQGVQPDCIVLSVGGGGLLSGVAEGLSKNNIGNTPIVAVETLGTNSFAQSLKRGELVTLENVNSVAKSLAARAVSEQALLVAKTHPVSSLVVSDKEAVVACLEFLESHKLVVEPACGAALSALSSERSAALPGTKDIVVIVCGGVCNDAEDLQHFANELQ